MAADVRHTAVRVIASLLGGGGSLTRLLPAAQERVAESDRALLQALCYGLARWHTQLEAIAANFMQKPLRAKDADVGLLIELGILQLLHMRIAPHAAVDQTVRALRPMKKPWARGLVNAVLRNVQRHPASLTDSLNPAERLALPAWMLTAWQHDWPDAWERLAEAGNQQAPMCLRVNARRTTVQDYLALLAAAGLGARAVAGLPQAILLESAVGVERLPGFFDGLVSVQDGAAQCAAPLLCESVSATTPRLLDACCAPGGKLAHALEIGDWHTVVALDSDSDRLARTDDTLARLGLGDVNCLAADAADTEAWWDGTPFDAILADVPCTGSGVIRRHPDIKLLRRQQDLPTTVALQARLLDSLWRTLAPGGVLLYATCSVFRDENDRQVADFLARTPDARVEPLALPAGRAMAPGWQILSGEGEAAMDGFFYTRLTRAA